MYSNGPSIIGVIYIIIGIIMAASNGYLTGLGTFSSFISAILAIALWPALLVGANLHVTFGALQR